MRKKPVLSIDLRQGHDTQGLGDAVVPVGATVVKTQAMVTKGSSEAMVPLSQPASEEMAFLEMLERLAVNPAADVVKMERIIAMRNAVRAEQARIAFWRAFADMQGELPSISKRGEIVVDGKVRSRFAENDDIQQAIKPILKKHGFAISFRNTTGSGDMAGWFTVTGVVAHVGGHTEEDSFTARADDSGKKNPIQAVGSTRAFGQRYVTKSLLNISEHGLDDDAGSDGDWRSDRRGRRDAPDAAEPSHNAEAYPKPSGKVITSVGRDGQGKGQRGRLWAIIKKSGRTNEEVKAHLLAMYGLTSSNDITQGAVYDRICADIEKPGALPVGPVVAGVEEPSGEREPGSDDE